MTMSADAAARARERALSFVARDIAGAVDDIRAKLGPEAVILDIRRLPARGLSRLWQQPQIEVLACLPDADQAPAETVSTPTPPNEAAPAPVLHAAVSQREAVQRYTRASVSNAYPMEDAPATVPFEMAAPAPEVLSGARHPSPWKCAAVLERLGLLPLHVERVLAQMQQLHGPGRFPPPSMAQELPLARTALLQLWRARPTAPASNDAPLHVFIGPHGSGKSTVLCKWLAQAVLLEGQAAQVWRLDGRTANASELVSIYGEILGVRVERTWHERGDPSLPGFVDLPGADFHDAESLPLLRRTLEQFPGAQVHLVLNAAYTIPLLLTQTRAFCTLPVSDLILTHLDEETSWSKLWNLVLGTNFPLGFLSAGQNIPGRFCAARPELLCPSLFGANRAC